MFAPHAQPAPVEKIRRVPWSDENTRKTQRVVDELLRCRNALLVVAGRDSKAVLAMDAALLRLSELDPNVLVEGERF